MTVRTRFAGSPTGQLHVGGAWMSFFNWLFARHHRGAFAIRMEDTDRSRSTRAFEESILGDLRWLGIDWDEGSDTGGPYGPYRQTDRFDLYDRYARELLERGAAYHCYCTAEELETERRQAQADRRSYRYSGRCRSLTAEERARFEAEGRRPVVRLRIQDYGRTIVVDDLVRGRVEFAPEHLDDYIIVRSDGSPLYNFANVVDDHLMEMTHVIRGAQHLSNTPKQWVMYEAFGWMPPLVAHVPEILGADKKKLSKRAGDTAVADYRRAGYLPEALLNFFALMGWYPGEDREIYSVSELIDRFGIEKLGRASPVFDLTKLQWMNGVYMRRLMEDDPRRVVEVCLIALQEEGLIPGLVSAEQRAYVEQVVQILGERLKIGRDVIAYGDFFFRDPVYDLGAVQKYLEQPRAAGRLRVLADRVEQSEGWSLAIAEAALRGLAEEQGIHARELIHPVRVALTGKVIGPGLFELMALLGKPRVVERLRRAAARAA